MKSFYREISWSRITALLCLFSLTFVFFGSVDAQTTATTLTNPIKANSLGALINTAVEVFTYVAIVVAVLAFIWVGLKFIMARGNPGKISEATTWLWYIIIGTAIVLGARIIIQVILSTLVGSGMISQEVGNSAQNGLTGK